MKRFVAFKLDDGSSIVVEVEEPETGGGTVRAGRGPADMVENAKHTFDNALEKIHSATESAITKLRNLSEKPNEITMEFGFNFSAEFGAIIAKATTDANYKVTLNWKRKEDT
jgi:Trypsin-co-occurring domain 1